MLVLHRKKLETVHIGDDVKILVLGFQSQGVRLGIDAPRSLAVHRGEVYDEIQAVDARKLGHTPAHGLTPVELAKRLIAASADGEGVLILTGHHDDIALCRAQIEHLECRQHLSAVVAIGLDEVEATA
jgi:carbon storage regulator